MRIDCLREIDQLDPLRDAWNKLAAHNPLQSWEWVRGWWDGYGDQGELFTLCFRDSGGAVVGIVPWYRRWSLAKGHSLEFLGSGRASSDDLTLLAEPSFLPDVVQGCVDWLRTPSADQRWDTLDLDGVQALDPHVSLFRKQLARHAFSITQLDSPSCWRLELPATIDEYLAARSPSVRRKVRDQLKRYRKSGGETVYRVAESAEEVSQWLPQIAHLHQARWDAAGVEGCFATPNFGIFLESVVRRFAERGELHLATVHHQGQVIAGSIGLIRSGIHSMYLIGMSHLNGRLNPGWLLNVGNLSHALEQKLTAIDFLRGDEPYKRRLGAEPRPQIRLRIAARQPLAQVRHRLWNAGRYCKNFTWLKPRPHQTPEPVSSSHETSE